MPLLSNDTTGANVIAAASYTNFAKVDSEGVDLGLNYVIGRGWRSSASYSWFHFSLPEEARAAEGLLLPNTPSHSVTAGLGYDRRRMSVSLDARWVDHFRWADGFFVGDVKSFVSMDATATYPVSAKTSVGVSATNLLDSDRWETFGGAIVRRRVLVSLRATTGSSPSRVTRNRSAILAHNDAVLPVKGRMIGLPCCLDWRRASTSCSTTPAMLSPATIGGLHRHLRS